MAQNIRYAKGTLKRFLFARLRTSSGQLYLGSRRSFPIPQLPSSLMTMMLPKGPAPAEKRASVPFGSRNIVIIDGGNNSPRHELENDSMDSFTCQSVTVLHFLLYLSPEFCPLDS